MVQPKVAILLHVLVAHHVIKKLQMVHALQIIAMLVMLHLMAAHHRIGLSVNEHTKMFILCPLLLMIKQADAQPQVIDVEDVDDHPPPDHNNVPSDALSGSCVF